MVVDNRRFISLASLTVIGDIILCASFTRNTTNDIVAILLAFIMSVVTIVLFKWLYEIWREKNFKGKEILTIVLMLTACALLIGIAVFTTYNFSKYASDVMLSTEQIFVPFLTFIVLACVLAFSNKNVLLKLALLLFPTVAIFIILMFAFSVQFMNIIYLIPYKSLSSIGFLDVLLPLFISLVTSAIPILVIGKGNKKRYFTISYVIGIAFLSLCFANVLALFGGELAATLEYPYSQAVSTASMGEIFSRMDGFLYAVCFFTCFIKTASCIFSAVYLIRRAVIKILWQKN